MIPRQKGKKWEICYRIKGRPKPFYERFDTFADAKVRIAEIERDRANGVLTAPLVSPITKETIPSASKVMTVSELMDEYVHVYGVNHWSESTLSCNLHRINDYINPFLGNICVQDLTTRFLDKFYSDLLEKPAVVMKGHKDRHNITASVIRKTHDLLRSALNQAVAWGYINVNPAMNCSPPEYEAERREVWSEEEAHRALSVCTDEVLETCMLLAIGCSMRIGEILGLTWDCVEIPEEIDPEALCRVKVEKELKRADRKSLDMLKNRQKGKTFLVFPEQINSRNCSTLLVLKEPKTKSSIRIVYLPQTVARHLKQVKTQQEEYKQLYGDSYFDFNLVVSQESGLPYEERLIAKKFKDFIRDQELTPVVFHSLRHCSTSLKLKLSGGDIKAVQGDTGHAQARMVTEVYSHMQDEDRRALAKRMERSFFQKGNGAPDTQDQTVRSAQKMLEQNPELAKLILAMANLKT